MTLRKEHAKTRFDGSVAPLEFFAAAPYRSGHIRESCHSGIIITPRLYVKWKINIDNIFAYHTESCLPITDQLSVYTLVYVSFKKVVDDYQ